VPCGHTVIRRSSRSSVSEKHLMDPFMSACLSMCSQELGNPHGLGLLLEHTAAILGTDVIVGS
jgi:hypothetical protein